MRCNINANERGPMAALGLDTMRYIEIQVVHLEHPYDTLQYLKRPWDMVLAVG